MKLCECGCGKPAPIAKQNYEKHGWIKGRPLRFIRGHAQRGRLLSLQAIFDRYAVRRDGCWEWKGATHTAGYGLLRFRNKMTKAHRASWELYNGPIQEGLHVLHHCDNPPCTRPDHLFLGTPKSNSDDKVRKNRQARGARLPQSKLTSDKVSALRQEYASGNCSQELLGQKYGVNRSAIGKIVRGERWASV